MAMSYSVGRDIDAAPERVWSLLIDAGSYRDWNPSIVSLEGRIAVGEKIRLASVAYPKRTFSLTVTDMERPHRMIWEQRGWERLGAAGVERRDRTRNAWAAITARFGQACTEAA